MSFFDSMNVSATGLSAQRMRMDVISENIANVNTTKAADGKPYKRKIALFEEISNPGSFASYFDKAVNDGGISPAKAGVKVSKIVEDERSGQKVFEPNHPDADKDGYVTMPNVNIVEEMVNMISASRSYEANITAISNTKQMIARTLELGR